MADPLLYIEVNNEEQKYKMHEFNIQIENNNDALQMPIYRRNMTNSFTETLE